MPQIFKIGGFIIYFWSDEGHPLEPIHVHIAKGTPDIDATKIWITQKGKGILSHNKSKISNIQLRKLIRMIEANSKKIEDKWYQYFDEISYYC